MSMYDDRDTAITRDPVQGQGQPQYQQYPQVQQQPYGYGYGNPYGRRFGGGGLGSGMHRGWSETKPFFLTSEFLGTILCILGVCIAAGATSDLDSHGAALFSSILVAAYTVSRGIAKAGTRSRANDFRDDMNIGRSHDGQSQSRHEHAG